VRGLLGYLDWGVGRAPWLAVEIGEMDDSNVLLDGIALDRLEHEGVVDRMTVLI
jgi:hypothetical protein